MLQVFLAAAAVITLAFLITLVTYVPALAEAVIERIRRGGHTTETTAPDRATDTAADTE